MWKRVLTAFALALAVGACKAPAPAAQTIAGVGDVRVLSVRFIPSTETSSGLASTSLTYVLATVELINDTPHDFTPEISRFYLTTARNQRYQGIDSGSSAMAGVSNAHRALKSGDRRTYTVGFRSADPVVTGTISYEP